MPLPGMIPTLAIAGVGVNDGVKRRGADDWSGDRGGGFDEAGDNDSSTEAGCLGVGGGNGGKAGPEHDERDDDDDVSAQTMLKTHNTVRIDILPEGVTE